MILRSVDANGFIRVNRAFENQTGFSVDELGAKPFVAWIDAEDRPLLLATLEGAEKRCRVRHQTRRGNLMTIDVHVSVRGDERIVLGCSTMGLEPMQVNAEEPQATVKGTLQVIAQIVEEQNPGYKCSILLVSDGRFVSGAGPSLPDDYNQAIDGYAVGPMVGSCGTAIYWNVPVIVTDIQADPLWVPFAALAKKAGVAACWSHPFTSHTGRVLGALALYSPEPRTPTQEQLGRLRAAARMTGLAVERGRAEEALREKRKRELELEDQLRQAAKMEALGVLAGGVAHDFNNVLATILANAEFALELLPPDSKARDMLKSVSEASRRAGQFCQQMLAYAGRSSLKTSQIELGALLPQLDDLVKAAISKKTTLRHELHKEPIFVKGDENQLLQVVMNLVTNAAEAIGDREGCIVVKTEVAHYDASSLQNLDATIELPEGEYARISVSDTGSGMDAETVARIFDPFFTTKFTGRGLGLAAVKGIVTKHGGLIHLESQLGRGTTFTILLPTTQQRPPSIQPPKPTDSILTAHNRRVLVVDDEEALRVILCRQLAHAGFDVLEATDGKQAIDLFRKEPDSIDCVLLDVSMPKLSGEEVYAELMALRDDVPVVLMSGFSETEIWERFQDAKLAGCLQKPTPRVQLIETIRNAIVQNEAGCG